MVFSEIVFSKAYIYGILFIELIIFSIYGANNRAFITNIAIYSFYGILNGFIVIAISKLIGSDSLNGERL